MRVLSRAALGGCLVAALALPAGAALAQVQQNDPNAANASLARQSDARAVQQQRVTDFNTLNMQAHRNVQYRPGAFDHGADGLRRVGGRHGGGRGRGASRSGFNTGVCVGC